MNGHHWAPNSHFRRAAVPVHASSLRFALLPMLVLLIFVSGCAIRLAPAFDRNIVDGLTEANEETLTLFASVSSGVQASTFPTREATYNALIGKFDALRIQAQARPEPRPLVTQLFGGGPDSNIAAPMNIKSTIPVLMSPTPSVLMTIVGSLTTMRDTDRMSGLSPAVGRLFKGEFEISIDQALVYEKALER